MHGLSEMIAEIERRKSPGTTFRYYDTICRQVANRVPRLRRFASEHDLILFVSGKKSSNGKILYGECKEVNQRTHLVSNPHKAVNFGMTELAVYDNLLVGCALVIRLLYTLLQVQHYRTRRINHVYAVGVMPKLTALWGRLTAMP